MCSDTITFDTLPAELLAKICQYFPRCDCDSEQASPSLLSLGCTGTHAPNLFTKSATLAQLRQTSRSLRNAALNRGLSQITGSSRWMRRRLHSIRELHGHRTRRLVFRSTDYVREGCSDSKTIMDQLEYFLAAQWPKLTAVAVEWFSGLTQDHEKIAELVQRHCGGRVRELFVRDKAVRLAAPGPWHNLAGIKRLAAVPYGYNRRWIDLQPAATVSDLYPVLASQESAGQLRALAVGGSDFSAALLQTLAQWQPLLNSLAVEHAWLEPLQSTQAKLSHVRRLHLEHVLADSTGLLPLTPQMFPKLETLTVRHVWTSAPRRSATARGAVSLQNPRWLVDGMLAHPWPCLTSLALPAITDDDAHALVKACPRLRRLATHSLDYSGPRLSAAGLAVLLSGLVDLQHLVIEQRRADGTPGYDVLDDALVRLLQQHRQRQQSVEIDADLEMVPLHRTASSTTTVAADSDMEDAGILCSAAAAAALAAAGSDTERTC
ncbi:hypothetical protein GGI07_002686 [Coemansia sp. Benny D115]|nr:hypothetical protein GGI07_002686 [Coemansia sp. Benny D115]